MLMVSHLISSTLLLVVVIFLLDTSSVSASNDHLTVPRVRHHQLANRLPRDIDQLAPSRRFRRRNSCIKPPPRNNSASLHSTSTSASKPATLLPLNGGGVPSGWQTVTRSAFGPTRTSDADPYLLSLSEAVDNSANHWFTSVHEGNMTYYGQGLGACGDTYDDKSFTAAVSMIMFDAWPGATAEQNRYVPEFLSYYVGLTHIVETQSAVLSFLGAR